MVCVYASMYVVAGNQCRVLKALQKRCHYVWETHVPIWKCTCLLEKRLQHALHRTIHLCSARSPWTTLSAVRSPCLSGSTTQSTNRKTWKPEPQHCRFYLEPTENRAPFDDQMQFVNLQFLSRNCWSGVSLSCFHLVIWSSQPWSPVGEGIITTASSIETFTCSNVGRLLIVCQFLA